MQRLSLLLGLLGVGVIAVLLAWFDVGAVWASVLSVGWAGFVLLLVSQGALFGVLALAWRTMLPGVDYPVLLWGRMVRDSATTCLPFSPVGGYVAGARAVMLGGVAWPTAAAGTAVDVTAEIVAQLLYALFGVAVLVLVRPGAPLAWPLLAGTGGVLGLLLLAWWQRRRIGAGVRALGSRLLGAWFAAEERVGRLETELARLAVPRRMAVGTGVHLVGWFGTGVWTWLGLRLLGSPADLVQVLALEALLDAVVAAAFVVPGAAGVQEAGYVGLGAAFGVSPELALSVSLLRRGKDLIWGMPVLLAWQWVEVRRLASRGG